MKVLLAVFLFAVSANAQKYYTYIEDLGPQYVELAWGTADGVNTIGRSSRSHGQATIKIAGQTVTSQLNSVTIGGLEPDHEYSYEVSLGSLNVGQGQVRTWADKADKLAFFVIGDYGTGKTPQYKVAEKMWEEFQKHEHSDNPIRFMLSTGDNIYGNVSSFLLGILHTGAQDADWEPKFFRPYEPLLGRIPFFLTLGNHDGNETEAQGDLAALLDNAPFPRDQPARYYTFTYGGLAQFFGLDSTKNTESGPTQASYLEGGPEFRWMQQEFAKPHPAWVIPYFHHPVFSAGPLHVPATYELQHWINLFAASGVKVAFSGHEHNFQVSEVNEASHGIRFITSGAGGELRAGSVRKKMKRSNIAAWAPENHFLLVEIDHKTMKVTPISFTEMKVQDADGHRVPLPITITLP